ncbi:hypothetical protein EMCRGX_G017965 [Ephydatia muelleri]
MLAHQQGQQPMQQNAESMKPTTKKCQELGWTCIPLAVETFGHWGKEAQAVFSRLASFIAIHRASPKSSVLNSRLNMSLVRGVETHPKAIYKHFSESLAWCFLLSVASRTAPTIAPASVKFELKDLAVRQQRCPGQRAFHDSNAAREYQQVMTANGQERAQHQLQFRLKHVHGEGSALTGP